MLGLLLITLATRPVPGPGVSLELARHRARTISDVRYDIRLAIPESADPVTGTVTVRFHLRIREPVVLDFRAPGANVRTVRDAHGNAVTPILTEDHITIPAAALIAGENEVTLDFTATDAALNRRGDYLYALFVPDRASTAFPCFDQPDLKARYRLRLRIPAAWRAVANGGLESVDSAATTKQLAFHETAPISTYLFTFAAGKLFVEEAERDGRHFTMYHRETDSAKVARNRDAVFDLHAAALRWLEDYTGIRYPFEKFDFFAVPAFQFGGMEHPGAVWYNAGALFLDQTATRNQLLGRASVISHETAHMWFGDLVTMRWFNDVWMKEVFANFMAGKIVGPSFPDINFGLRFFLGNHPTAYGADRTAGANPIRQPLENLREAGQLYGAIIYQKAPIVMRQLERTIGEDVMRQGLREYLAGHRFGNATWPDLISLLDRLSPEDLAAWSRVWVEQPGRPLITSSVRGTVLHVAQRDPRGRGLLWRQRIGVTLGSGDSTRQIAVALRGPSTTIPLGFRPGFVLAGTDGIGYGRFAMDARSRAALLGRLSRIADPVVRSAAWQTLQEEMIDGRLPPPDLLTAALRALPDEQDDLIGQQLLGLIGGTYWRFLADSVRGQMAPEVERVLWQQLDQAGTPGKKGSFFQALVGLTLTPGGMARLERIWRKDETPVGLPLAEQQYTQLAEALAVRRVPGSEAILDQEARRITDPDRIARFRFVRGALSPTQAVRDSLFAGFRDLANRRRESWVVDALSYLNHPLHARESERYVGPSLDLLLEIKQTGDLFFPTNWLNAALDGHQSRGAAGTVARFLAEHPAYPPRLRGKVLQVSDGLFRAARIVDGWAPGKL